MWITALLGMALKYAECSLSHYYRVINEDGSASGGPMYYIQRGLGEKWKPLAVAFASFAVICSFCTGNMNQANTIGQIFATNHHEVKLLKYEYEVTYLEVGHHFNGYVFDSETGISIFNDSKHIVSQVDLDYFKRLEITSVTEFNTEELLGSELVNSKLFGSGHVIKESDIPAIINEDFDSVFIKKVFIPEWISGLIIATLVGLVIIGGIKRIAAVASRLVPTMAAIYVISAVMVLFFNYDAILPSIKLIITQAFNPEAKWGGVLVVMMWGIRRGLYSNEAGQGSAPIAHAAAKTKESIREGAVALMGPFIDTLVVCTMTGLVILTTGVLDSTDLTGAQLTREAFTMGFTFAPEIGTFIVNTSVLLFAYTTMVAWSYYGDRSIEYLMGPQAVKPYRWVYVFFNFLGAILPLAFVWNFGDIALSPYDNS
jgi:Na+/alanine symporter